MADTFFWTITSPVPLGAIADRTGATIADEDRVVPIAKPAPLELAGPADLSFVRAAKHLPGLRATRAGAVLVQEKFVAEVPAGARALVVDDPQAAFALAVGLFFPDALVPQPMGAEPGVSERAVVDPTARLEDGVVIEAGAFVGAEAEIGAGTIVGPNAVVGPKVKIGRNSAVGANATVQHALIGDRVVIHPGCSIGQDGFGYVMGRDGHRKVPQVGRVIIQDDVEIGANTAIDRGSNRDTTIGKGTKIDNLVQVGHNVTIGNHCVLAGKSGVSGSSVLEDYVVLAGNVGVGDHLRIGRGAQIAGSSNVADDVPPGGRWVGTPARPVRRWMKELMALSALAAGGVTSARERRRAGRGSDE